MSEIFKSTRVGIFSSIALITLGIFIVVTSQKAQHELDDMHAMIDTLQPQAERLEHYCALTRITTQAVLEDAATMPSAAIRTWNTLATIDHRALTPCLRPPIIFGHAYIAPELVPCGETDIACAQQNAAIALANFAVP